MKNLNSKRKHWKVLKAAIWGAALFVGISLLVFWSDSNLVWVFSIPAGYLNQALKLDGVFPIFVNSVAFGLVINGLLGAIIFAISVGICQFIVKAFIIHRHKIEKEKTT